LPLLSIQRRRDRGGTTCYLCVTCGTQYADRSGGEFDDLYGFTWDLDIVGDARRAVDESFDRYLPAIAS
jgi:hypothetical protein